MLNKGKMPMKSPEVCWQGHGSFYIVQVSRYRGLEDAVLTHDICGMARALRDDSA